MIQPLAKLRFVERYCNPVDGWKVFVDIDPSEEGRTGSPRTSTEARNRQAVVLRDVPKIVGELKALGAIIGSRKANWLATFGQQFAVPAGDRDIIAVHAARRVLWIAEVEGDSGGQPEGKIYKALGQLVCALTESHIEGFQRRLSLVVWGEKPARHLARASAIAQLGVSGLVIAEASKDDRWLFGAPDLVVTKMPPIIGLQPTACDSEPPLVNADR